MALEYYLALHNECSVAQLHLTFLVKLAVVAALSTFQMNSYHKGIKIDFHTNMNNYKTQKP